MATVRPRASDCWLTPTFRASDYRPDFLVRVARDYFHDMMTSAYAPKYLPAELIQFMDTRGQTKILFASDHPVLSFARCLAEATELPLREGVLERYLRANALAVFRWD